MTKSDSPSSRKKDLKSGRKTSSSIVVADSIFEDYIIESATANNIINLQVSLAHLNRALRSAITASSASLRLTKKNDIPVLSLTILTTTLATPFARNPITSLENGRSEHPRHLPSEALGDNDSIAHAPTVSAFDRETTIMQSIPVTVLNPITVANIHEPTSLRPPRFPFPFAIPNLHHHKSQCVIILQQRRHYELIILETHSLRFTVRRTQDRRRDFGAQDRVEMGGAGESGVGS
ncbi:MAG: hypothetical protein Q9194_004416 [Teloschistes cf. exilis]